MNMPIEQEKQQMQSQSEPILQFGNIQFQFNKQERMKKFFQQHRTAIAFTGVGLTALAFFLYLGKLNGKTSLKMSPKPKELSFDQKYAIIINQVQQIMDKKNRADEHNLQLIFKIYRGQYILANEEAKRQILRSREERRNCFKDQIQYAQIVAASERQIQLILQKHLNAILARFSIDKSQWVEEVSKLESSSEEVKSEWEQMIKDEDEKQLLSLRNESLKPKSFSDIQKILMFKIHKLEVLKAEELALDIGIDETAKYNILESYLRDLVFFEFGVEEELFTHSVSLLTEKEKQKLEEKYSQVSMLMSSFIFDDIDIEGENIQQEYY